MVLKVAPPLMIDEHQLDEFIAAVANVVEVYCISYRQLSWSEALGLARHAWSTSECQICQTDNRCISSWAAALPDWLRL